jgi:hypothetical protein
VVFCRFIPLLCGILMCFFGYCQITAFLLGITLIKRKKSALKLVCVCCESKSVEFGISFLKVLLKNRH